MASAYNSPVFPPPRTPRIARSPIERKGIPKNFSLDEDVVPLIAALTANKKSVGKLVSELLRKEYDRRAERLALLPIVTQAGME